MSTKKILLLAAGTFCAVPAYAADFGVMEAADTVTPRHFKLEGYPMAIRSNERTGGEDERGFSGSLGYGIIDNLDVEGRVTRFSDATYYGGNGEYMFYNAYRVQLSAASGAHYAHTDFGNQWGLNFASMSSYTPPALPKMKLNGAINVAWDKPDFTGPRVVDRNDPYFTAYAVPGVQYRVIRDLDVIGEVGLGLNGDSSDYVSAGLSYYLR